MDCLSGQHPPTVDESIRIEDLEWGLSPRLEQVDAQHVRVLSEQFDSLPPIVVHADSMSIIDGVHRVHAARTLGRSEIVARLFQGNTADAFVEAVRLNTTHGKPLTLAERNRAVAQVLQAHPEWSDRYISTLCGLSAGSVAKARSRSTSGGPQPDGRLGRDGKWRPTDPSRARQRTAELLAMEPNATLRELAVQANTSQATVLDVRRRLRRGDTPTTSPRLRSSGASPQLMESRPAEFVGEAAFTTSANRHEFARWFDQHNLTGDEIAGFSDLVPLGRVYEVVDEVRRRIAIWSSFISLLEERGRATTANVG